MTTIAVRAKFRATTLHVGDLVRHACSDLPPCPHHGRVGVLRYRQALMWVVDFGDCIEWCWSEGLTGVKRGAA
jgi:hypothetical protein